MKAERIAAWQTENSHDMMFVERDKLRRIGVEGLVDQLSSVTRMRLDTEDRQFSRYTARKIQFNLVIFTQFWEYFVGRATFHTDILLPIEDEGDEKEKHDR